MSHCRHPIMALLMLALSSPALADEDMWDDLFGGETQNDTQTSADTTDSTDNGATAAESAPLKTITLPDEEPPEVRRPRSGSRLIEEIVVTAQKREESLQDVPISVQAFSGEMLDAMGVHDQTDLQMVTPGLNVTTQVSYVMTFLRGIGTDATIAADPSVATYIDGIYYPFASNLAQNFGAVDRIEVLKGPQGTLFGRNATGGAIAIYTKEPDYDEVAGELLADVGSFNSHQARLHVNLPLGDASAFSLTAVGSETDGYYSGTHGTPERSIPGDNFSGFRLKFRAEPVEDLDLRLAALRTEMHLGTGSVGFTAYPSELGAAQGVEPQPGYTGTVDALLRNDTDANTVFYGSAAYATNWFDFKLIGSDQRMDTIGVRDFDGSPQVLSTLDTPSQFIDAQSMELQILSNGDWGPDWLEWIVGGFYFGGTNGFGELRFIVNGIDLASGMVAGQTVPAGLLDVLSSGGAPGPSGVINMIGLIGTDSRALFSQATVTLTDWLDVTLGGRYQIEDRWIAKSTVGLENADGSVTPVADNTDTATDSDDNPYPAHDTQKNFSPKLSIQLRPLGDDTMIYLSWQEAVKAATYNTVAIYDSPDYVAPEELEAFELGVKTSLFDGLMQLDAAAFAYDVRNLQTYYLSTMAGGVISFQNAGRAKIKGFEIGGAAQLLPARISDLAVRGGAAWLDATYAEFTDGAGFDEDGNFVEGQDWTGNQVIRTPKLTFTGSLSKTWPIWGGPLEAVFDAYYTDDFYYEASNRAVSKQEAYWLFGSRLSYLFNDWDLRATLGVRNLTDKFYSAGFFATDYGVQPNWAPPRSVSLQLLWNF